MRFVDATVVFVGRLMPLVGKFLPFVLLARSRASREHKSGGLPKIASLALLSLLGASATALAQTQGSSRGSPQSQPSGQQMDQMADHAMPMTGPLGITFNRDGSGTSWLPDTTPMRAAHWSRGPWMIMLHGNAFIQYIDEGGSRGDGQFGSINWIMGMARRSVGGGSLTLRGMFSIEPLTVGKCGYPDVLATGELCNGEPLHDRQHPHDLFMEVAAVYERELGHRVGLQLYGAPAGEPALGPTAYPHRSSSMALVLAPMTHHWLDSTHISFGVLTAGIFQSRWKAEASVFNGREPDENRYGFDLAKLDSYSGRLSYLPTSHWSLQASAGRIAQAEPPHGGEPAKDVTRVTASGTYHQNIRAAGFWATTVGWGSNREEDLNTNAVLVETSVSLDEKNTIFGRTEFAQKTDRDLVALNASDIRSWVSKIQFGYERALKPLRSLTPGVGAAATINVTPQRLSPAYGDSPSTGVVVFFSLRPNAMRMANMSHAMNPTMPTSGPRR